MAANRSPRLGEIVAAARTVLENGGAEALTMRAVADHLGIRAPSLYNHVPNKAALELAIIVDGFTEAAEAFEAAEADTDDPLGAFAATYRRFAADHPHVYRLMTEQPLPRESMPSGVEARTAAPLLRAMGDMALVRAAWAYLHGMTMLELNGRIPEDDVTEAAWARGIAAFRSTAQIYSPDPSP